MSKRKPNPEAVDPENPEWTEADFRKARPASEALPQTLLRKLGVRGQQKTPTKEQINIRLSQSVLKAFRAAGAGWQTRIDEALQDWLKTHKPA
jgi:uncharacterized protein (DUF4415 family)